MISNFSTKGGSASGGGFQIAVLMGGPSREREISLKSGKAISEALQRKNYCILEITEMDDLSNQLLKAKIDVVFIALHGHFGEDGTVQKILEDCGIAYTGSGPEASHLAMHKDLAKKAFIQAGLSTPPGFSGHFETFQALEKKLNGLKFPVVLKPAAQGSSIGLEIVPILKDFFAAFERIRNISTEILIEQFIRGSELTVGVLGGQALPIVKICTDRTFYDYEAKYSPGHTTYEVPAGLPKTVYERVEKVGLEAYEALGCRDFSRVDILLDEEETPWVLEVNTIPGFTERSLLPKAAQAAGIAFDDLCEQILTMALRRKRLITS